MLQSMGLQKVGHNLATEQQKEKQKNPQGRGRKRGLRVLVGTQPSYPGGCQRELWFPSDVRGVAVWSSR